MALLGESSRTIYNLRKSPLIIYRRNSLISYGTNEFEYVEKRTGNTRGKSETSAFLYFTAASLMLH
jgi:hypothetical protein